ncbi:MULTISPECIES: type IV pilin protein [Vibrio]|uniref:Pilus assembly protein PilA n=1 Tax=Vibrio bivalvicida TaxID=1276888 RepID=A0A177Y3C6_9VIBR|nr:MULTISPECIES: pilin [Vibrio]KLN64144.1 pilus assembly protein PilA [Vibrio sp. VPAP30]OAJ95374.1 pilus assembly protein PilA [Vibrio bivalvicida]
MQTLQGRKTRGFTLIELMIVVAIIGVLASMAIPAYKDYVRKSEAASALATLKSLITPAEVFYQENGTTSAATLSNLGIDSGANNLGTIASTISGTGSAAVPTLKFTFGLDSTMGSSDTITYSRNSSTGWSCSKAGAVPSLDGCS